MSKRAKKKKKTTIRLARPAKIQISQCLLQPLGYPKRDKREPLPCCMDVEADLNLCWLHRSYYRLYLEVALLSSREAKSFL